MERPILFSGPMVRAILEDRKTQTRRVMKPQPANDIAPVAMPNPSVQAWRSSLRHQFGSRMVHLCPYGRPGQHLWVRETWGCKDADRPGVPGGRKPQPGDAIQYAENDADAWQWRVPGALPWRPSIHMPRWASRILLEITDVRVQRVQDISEKDAFAEGCFATGTIGRHDWRSSTDNFSELWDSINEKRGFGWDANPWVWALTFKRMTEAVE